jgi:hypothetical protein
LARTLANPCLGHEPKARFVTPFLLKDINKVFVLLEELDGFWFRLKILVVGWVDMDGEGLKNPGSPIKRCCSNKGDPYMTGFLNMIIENTRFGSDHRGAFDCRT